MSFYHTKPTRETQIRTLRIRGIAVSCSQQRGGLLIWGKPEFKGLRITLDGWDGEVPFGEKVHQSFITHTDKGRRQYVAVFPRLVPGTYLIKSDIPGRSYERVTISSGYVSQLDWS